MDNLELIEVIRKDANIIDLNLDNFDLKLKAIAALSIFRPVETLEYVNKLIELHKQYLPLISFDELVKSTLNKKRTSEQQFSASISHALHIIFENLALSLNREVALVHIKQLIKIHDKEEFNYLETNFKEADALVKSNLNYFYYFSDTLPGGDMDGVLSYLEKIFRKNFSKKI